MRDKNKDLPLPGLTAAVEKLAECAAEFKQDDHIVESFQGEVIWDGPVATFALTGHPDASQCYAWSEYIKETGKRRYYTVLAISPISTPWDAVRASIVFDHRQSTA